MKSEHYNFLIKKTKILVGKIDGYDVGEIAYFIGDFASDNGGSKYRELDEELFDILNIMLCEYGLDYGKTQNWDSVIINILEFFSDGYTKNEQNLDKLLLFICNGIENKSNCG